MVDDKFDGHIGIHECRIATELGQCIAKHSQVDDGRNSCEVLEEDALWVEGHHVDRGSALRPRRQCFDVAGGDRSTVLVT